MEVSAVVHIRQAARLAAQLLALVAGGVALCPIDPASAADIKPVLVTCPASGHDFFGLEIRAVNTLKSRDGDFLLRAEGGNQYATWIWTCPYCFFSARQEVFTQERKVEFDPSSVETMELTYEAMESERLQLLIPPALKYRNAAAYYFSIGETPYSLGVLNLQGSWAVRMSKVSMPKGLFGTWWKSYMHVTDEGEYSSEEQQLVAVAEDLRDELNHVGRGGNKAEKLKLEFLIASTLRQAGEHRQAVPMLEKLASMPDLEEIAEAAAKELELARTETAFQEEALRYFKDAVKLEETLPDDRLQSIYLIGELSRRLGDYEQAKVWFARADETPMPQLWARNMLERQKRKLAEDMAAAD